MSNQPSEDIDASRPDSPIHLRGTDHITLEGTNKDETIAYYRDLLGCPLVLSQPNLDRKELTHLFFDTGDGRLISFFVSDDRETTSLDKPQPGQVHHLAFRIAGDQLAEIEESLTEAGYPVSEYDRGAFHSLYTRDPNGLTIELVADKFTVPSEKRGEVLAVAHHLRVEEGAEFVETRHMEEAISELGLEVEQFDLRDADPGRDFPGRE